MEIAGPDLAAQAPDASGALEELLGTSQEQTPTAQPAVEQAPMAQPVVESAEADPEDGRTAGL